MRDRYLCKAKRTDNGEWVEGYIVEYPSGKMEIYKKAIEVLCICEVDPSTICQCTGLTDKNSKKIWENDIVKEFADCDESGNSLYYYYQIRWNEGYCAFEGREIYTKETEVVPDLEDIEIIGNIFDNPELVVMEGEEKQNG